MMLALRLILVVLLLSGHVAHSQINLKINAEKSKRFKLILAPTLIVNGGQGKLCAMPEQKIANSLQLFSTFNVLPVDPDAQPSAAKLDHFEAPLRLKYSVQGADFFVRSKLTSSADNCSITWAMFSVASGQLIDSGDFQLVHKYSAGLYYYLADRISLLLNGKKTLHFSEITYTVRKVSKAGKLSWKLVRAWANGEIIEELLSSNQPLLSPSWSHDGQKLAYVTFDASRNQVVRIMDMTTKRVYNPIASLSPSSSPAWSPSDDALIVAVSQQGHKNLFIQPLDNSELIRLTKQAAIDTEPEWSPDGRLLAYVSDRSGIATVYSFDMFTGTRTRITRDGVRASLPKFIRKNYAAKLQLLYVSGVGASSNLMIIEHDSLKQVVKIPLPNIDQFDVSPSGDYIIVTLPFNNDLDAGQSRNSVVICDIASDTIIEVVGFEQVITGLAWRPSSINLFNG